LQEARGVVLKGKRRHDFIFRLAYILFHRHFARKFNFEYDNIKVERPPFIVVSNHLTNWDPILIALSFGKNIYYVATDQIFRMGFKSKLLTYFFSPIAKAKTAQETQTVITIFRRLKENCNICIFAEGNTSFDGETGEIQPAIAKLVKRAGVTLVTYRFTGSYFTFPRWARFIRKGKMEGRLAQIYSPEKIASMSEQEIYEAIKNDIHASAYSEQEKNKIAYRGKNPAEYLETVLYCCPKCRQFALLASRGDIIYCACGFKARYNEFGYFETPNKEKDPQREEPPFKTITDWVKWERKEIEALALSLDSRNTEEPIFTDENQLLFEIEKTVKRVLIAKGTLSLYKDRLSVTSEPGQKTEFPLDTIIEMSSFARMTLIFSTKDNKIFEIHSKHSRSALKYLDMFKEIKKLHRSS
jgi:1-acyl-sn-glycerol-3-phosphate acyltransferase